MAKIISERLLPPDDPMFSGGSDTFIETVMEIWISLRAEQMVGADPDKETEAYWAGIERAHMMAEWEWSYDDGDFENADDPLLDKAIQRANEVLDGEVQFFGVKKPHGPA